MMLQSISPFCSLSCSMEATSHSGDREIAVHKAASYDGILRASVQRVGARQQRSGKLYDLSLRAKGNGYRQA